MLLKSEDQTLHHAVGVLPEYSSNPEKAHTGWIAMLYVCSML